MTKNQKIVLKAKKLMVKASTDFEGVQNVTEYLEKATSMKSEVIDAVCLKLLDLRTMQGFIN